MEELALRRVSLQGPWLGKDREDTGLHSPALLGNLGVPLRFQESWLISSLAEENNACGEVSFSLSCFA